MIFYEDIIIMCLFCIIFVPAILIVILSLYHLKKYLGAKWLKYHYERLPNNAECSICLELTKSDGLSEAYRLPCSHWFHKFCLRRWLQHNNNCPNCRHPVNYWNGERLFRASREYVDFDDIDDDDQLIQPPTAPQNYNPRSWTRLATSGFDPE